MSTPAKKPNGSKSRVPLTCPHADDCAAPRMHAEVMASLDQLSTSVGLMLESVADIRERLTVAEQREEQHLLTVAGLHRDAARLASEAVREYLPGVVRDEIGRLRLPGGSNA